EHNAPGSAPTEGVAVDTHNAQQLLEKMLPRIRWDLIAARDQDIHDVLKYVEHLQTAKNLPKPTRSSLSSCCLV
ncbi:unnamed protein product, partial [Urochloa humidicola]